MTTKRLDFRNDELVRAGVQACVDEGAGSIEELAHLLTVAGFRTKRGTPISGANLRHRMVKLVH